MILNEQEQLKFIMNKILPDKPVNHDKVDDDVYTDKFLPANNLSYSSQPVELLIDSTIIEY